MLHSWTPVRQFLIADCINYAEIYSAIIMYYGSKFEVISKLYFKPCDNHYQNININYFTSTLESIRVDLKKVGFLSSSTGELGTFNKSIFAGFSLA